VQTCFQALGVIGQAFSSATRALEVIMGVKRKWQKREQANAGLKRQSSIFEWKNDEDNMSKRRRSIHRREEPIHTDTTSQYEEETGQLGATDAMSDISWMRDSQSLSQSICDMFVVGPTQTGLKDGVFAAD
jgi:hypothetical protein